MSGTEYILVTGGLGYIGSHTVVQLIENKYNVIIIDNLYNSKLYVLDRIKDITGIKPIFYQYDLNNYEFIDSVFKENKITKVIHFAAYKAVGESVKKPVEYYENNILTTLNVVKAMIKYGCENLIFSSSCTVYGSIKSPLTEDMPTGFDITNPYGKSKYMLEEMLKDISKANPSMSIVLLRYFNPIGCHSSGLIGEDPQGIPTCLFPYILRVAKGEYPILNIFGNTYKTRDGTAIRDYIHVLDIADGHIDALKLNQGLYIYNLGTGKGYTVLEVIERFEEVNKIKIPYRFVEKREGDLEETYASNIKALAHLNWKPSRTLDDMVRDGWNFIKSI
jgi:UDP-glucose 4-epimerase